ncbi:MAG: T9SS type A sorting domain-containing protein [Ignavibacteria bacterium]|jgi:hypothetical protein|nr:T9SS type A sorting domain-containing protein [Ignavibacteria bacterium]MCU7502922.1 T9SS type A sorting domain-containing protein [Ignavibacteria bacterium]MCU7515584.1 T9SS type A sorting domain-containing protein [Ignavibacteria bacterium]
MKKILLSLFFMLNSLLFSQSSKWITFNGANSRLPNNSICAVAIDSQEVKWFGTEGYGLASFDGTAWTIYNSNNSGLSNNFVRVIYIDKENNKWIGTRYGGLYKFDGSQWTNWNTSNSILPSNWVASFVIDPEGIIWVGTGDKGLVRIEKDYWTIFNTANSPLPVNFIYALAADSLGNTWIGTNGGGLVRYNRGTWEIKNKYNSNLSCNASLSIAIDRNYDKWIASFSCGLFRLHDTTFTKYDKARTPLHDNWVACVTLDKQQAKWLGMDSTGVAKFSGNQWTLYDTANSGLVDKYVRSIAIDRLGNKWIGTYRGGVSVFNETGVNILPVIVISKPLNAESWIAGSRQKITWATSNVAGNVNIRLSTDGGATFPFDLALNSPNDGYEEITVPEVSSSQCMIRIESISFSQIQGRTGGRFQIAKMSVPIQNKPANNSLRQPLELKITWQKGELCNSYNLLVASDSAFLHPVLEDSSITDTVKELKGLTDFRKYYWKVRGLNNSIYTKWSPVWSFTTIFNAPSNLKASPEGHDKSLLTWQDNSSSETGYVLERNSGGGFTQLTQLPANSSRFIDSSLGLPGSYQYRLKAVAEGGESEYSNVATAEITDVDEAPALVKDFVLGQNFPNPFNPSTTIRYSLPSEEFVSLKVYNLLGCEVAALVNEVQKAGSHSVRFNARELPSGTYVYTIKAGGFRFSRKLLLLK